jgi:hypothetical protein
MQAYEMDKSLFLSKLTENSDLLRQLQDESRSIIMQSSEAEKIQAAQKILRDSSKRMAAWESIMKHKEDDIAMLRDSIAVVREYSWDPDMASRFKSYVDRVSEDIPPDIVRKNAAITDYLNNTNNENSE